MVDISLVFRYHVFMTIYTLIDAVGICLLMVMGWLILDVAWDALTEESGEDE